MESTPDRHQTLASLRGRREETMTFAAGERKHDVTVLRPAGEAASLPRSCAAVASSGLGGVMPNEEHT
jgi:hypothetical protein